VRRGKIKRFVPIYCNDNCINHNFQAAFRICALARSLHPWSDLPTDTFPSVLLKQKKVKANGNAVKTEADDLESSVEKEEENDESTATEQEENMENGETE